MVFVLVVVVVQVKENKIILSDTEGRHELGDLVTSQSFVLLAPYVYVQKHSGSYITADSICENPAPSRQQLNLRRLFWHGRGHRSSSR